MEIGMLWYDDSPLALKDRLEKAADYYTGKYGRKPNLCLVNPNMLTEDEVRFNGVLVRRGRSVMPGHFWIGVDDDPAEPDLGETSASSDLAELRRSAEPAQRTGAKRSSGRKITSSRSADKPGKSSKGAP
ncbi:MAG: hypothetical protein AABY97_01480 [Chloroflexota bacterium]